MAEALISPGVFLRENDQSQITAGPITVGAALLGPTVIGKPNIPTLVTSYSQYRAKFGTTFVSGGTTREYLTSQAAYNYFQQGGESLLVTRVASGSYTPATASVYNNLGARASASLTPTFASGDYFELDNGPVTSRFFVTSSTTQVDNPGSNVYYVVRANTTAETITNIANKLSAAAIIQTTGVTATAANTTLNLKALYAGTAGNSFTYSDTNDYVAPVNFDGGIDPVASFILETLSVGEAMNNSGDALLSVGGLLPSGSVTNVRWQITQADTATGYFTLLVRRGDDYNNAQTVLETWTNLSLDPNQNNYIAYVIGDQTQTILTDETGQAYLQISGNYPNASNYIRVKEVLTPTPSYLDSRGKAKTEFTGSIPVNGSGSLNGSFGGATGPMYGCYNQAPLNLFEEIPTVESTTPATNIQGTLAANYDLAINLLGNKDLYRYNSIYAPGLTNQNAPSQMSAIMSTVQGRGDAIAVVDMVGYGQSLTAATTAAQSYDNSYAATYWPWVQVRSTETGKQNFIPASAIIPAVYEYNDRVSAEWFAPAGLNRGGLPTVIRPERSLTVAQRNTLYTAKVNPIAVFPGQGTVVYGQKTLQAKASALDRVNVRRLLIALKTYIGQIAETLVFEQNTAVTRNRFLSQVNPYLQYVQQKQGLYSFRVVMDDTNNTPDVIDRNLLVGAIYLQPTRTAEFIQLDFNILPTGVTFGQ